MFFHHIGSFSQYSTPLYPTRDDDDVQNCCTYSVSLLSLLFLYSFVIILFFYQFLFFTFFSIFIFFSSILAFLDFSESHDIFSISLSFWRTKKTKERSENTGKRVPYFWSTWEIRGSYPWVVNSWNQLLFSLDQKVGHQKVKVYLYISRYVLEQVVCWSSYYIALNTLVFSSSCSSMLMPILKPNIRIFRSVSRTLRDFSLFKI